MTDIDYDAAIIGSGASGLSAAACAAHAGARVLVAEAEPVIGGSSRLSTGIIMGAGTRFQRAQGIDDSAGDLFYGVAQVPDQRAPGADRRIMPLGR